MPNYVSKHQGVIAGATPLPIDLTTGTPPVDGGGSLILCSLFSSNWGIAFTASAVGGSGFTGGTPIFDSVGTAVNVVGLLIFNVSYTTKPTAINISNGGGSPYGAAVIYHYDGPLTVDVISAAINSASDRSPIASGLPNITDATSKVFGVLTLQDSGLTITPGAAGWTQEDEIDEGNATYQTLSVISRIPGATGAFDPDWGTNSLSGVSAWYAAGVAIKNLAGGDTTAPVLTSATGTPTGSRTATVGATTDEANGTMFAVVTTSATQPSIAQIKAGQNEAGAAAAWAGSQGITTTGAKTFSATGLTPSTTYYAHIVHADAAANDSNRVSSSSFKTYQYAAPTSDVSAGSWTPSTGASLFGVLDETTVDDADFIATLTAADQCSVGVASLSDPASSSGHIVTYRLKGDGTSGITVALMQSTTVIASWTHDPAPTSFTTYQQTLSGAEADSITDYTALRLRFTEV